MKNHAGDKPVFWKAPGFRGIRAALFLFLAASLFGCTTVEKTTRLIARDLNPTLGALKIRMALLPLMDRTGLKSDGLKSAFEKPVQSAIRHHCGAVLLETGTDLLGFDDADALFRSPSGRLDAYRLCEAGRRHGFNAIASIGIESIGVRVIERGILWFKGERHMLQIHGDAEIFDTRTGTKALSRDFYFETQVDESFQMQPGSPAHLELPQIRKGLLQIAGEMGDAICEALNDLPWQGYVTAVKGNTLFLSAGKRTGVKPGMVLTVFEQGRIIEGIDGQKFIIPGEPKGEVKIVSSASNTAEAEILSGGSVKEGDFVGFE